MQNLRYCRTLYDRLKTKCWPFLNSKSVGKLFGKSVFILSIFVFVKFSTFSKIKNGKNCEIVKHFWYNNFIDNILSFGPHMNPTNLYWMTLKEIYIFGHIGLQMQGGILHSKIMFFCQDWNEITKNHLKYNNKWRFWNDKTLSFPKVPDFWKFEWLLSVLQSFIRWALYSLEWNQANAFFYAQPSQKKLSFHISWMERYVVYRIALLWISNYGPFDFRLVQQLLWH